MVERLFYGRDRDMAFASYGEHWRQARRVCVLHLLSQRCVLSFRRVRQQETAALIGRVRRDAAAAVNLSHLLVVYSSAVLLRAAFGNDDDDDSSYGLDGEGEILRKLLVDAEELLGLGTLGEVVPWLAWVNSVRGVHAKAARTSEALDGFLERGIADHHTRRHRGGPRKGDGGGDENRRSFASVLLDVKEEEEAGGIQFDTAAVKAIILDMFLAGSSTTASIVESAMAELINHPDEMRKLQEEIRAAIIHDGGDNQITEDHLGKLRRLKPVLKETLRLHMPSPLVHRQTVEDTELLGYHVPARTRVIIDVGAIARDPATWERAGEFLPERWFGDDGASAAVAGQDFTFLPFGGGRRGCPGAGFGMASVDLVLTSLLYHFDWELPAGGASTVDMDVVGELAVRLKKPLCLVAKPWCP
ncbi:hypothetical protein PVAP13_8NG184801 [Panicum virgatum]|nr:hypothetical protein PVAP13_8NG184801 [Panicum virgatum]